MILQVVRAFLLLSALALPLWAAGRVAVNVRGRRRGRRASFGRELLLASFVVYLALLAAVTVVPLPVSRAGRPGADAINLVPVRRTQRCLTVGLEDVPESVHFCLVNVLGNVALFAPLGFMAPLISGKFRSLWRVVALALLVSVAIELTQLLARSAGVYRAVDVDDVILNVLGACLGYACFAALVRKNRGIIDSFAEHLTL